MSEIKVFMAELPKELHSKMKVAAAEQNSSMKQFVNDAIEKALMDKQENKVDFQEIVNALRRSYNFVKDGPNPSLTDCLKNLLEELS
jgi:hypothetical protein